MQRITIKDLRNLAAMLNKITNSPAEYSTQVDGKFSANVGHYHISQAYGGYCLHRVMNTGGGVTCPIRHGHGPARVLYDSMHAYIRGLEADVVKQDQTRRAERTRKLLADYLGNSDEFAMLKGVLCASHAQETDDAKTLHGLFDNILIAKRMDAINNAALIAAGVDA